MLRRNRLEALPAAIEVEIISRLYAALPQILCIGAGVIVGAAIMAVRTGDVILWAVFAAAIVTSLARVVGIWAFRSRGGRAMTLAEAHRWEDLYAWSAFAFTAVIAALTIRIFQAGHMDGAILAVGLVMSLTAGSSARTMRFWICATLSTIALGVLIACMWLTGDLLMRTMAMLLALYLYSVYESSAYIVKQMESVLIAERELDHIARKDALTGIANRRAFDEMLAAEVGAGRGFALLLLDLDGFKAVNDRFGHAVGDDLLRQVAERLGLVTRQADVLARLGGDEFAIILKGADAGSARIVADRAVVAIAQSFTVLGQTATVGTSIGIEVIPSGPRQVDADSVKQAADRALYDAKRAGKGRAHFRREAAAATGRRAASA